MTDDEKKIADENSEEKSEEAVVVKKDPDWGSVITVGHTTYAVSLFWQPLQDVEDPLPEIRETAESILEGADLYCLRTDNALQYGLGVSEEGHRVGQPAAAIAVADAFADQPSSVAVFEVPEGWWFVAIRNDIILSEEDVLYKSEEEAKKAYYSMMAVPDWGRKVAPDSWGIEGTIEIGIEEILRNAKQVKLQRLGNVKGTKYLIAIVAAVLVLLYVLWNVLSNLFTPEVKVKPVAPVAALPEAPKIQTQTKIAPMQAEKKLQIPWVGRPYVGDLLNECYELTVQVKGLAAPGWQMVNVTCNEQGVFAMWDRKWGRIDWLNKAINSYGIAFEEKTLEPSGNRFIGTKGIEFKRITLELGLNLEEARNEILDIFQAIGQPLALAEAKEVNKVVAGIDFGVEQEVEYPYLRFGFTSLFDPPLWSAVLTRISGLEITSIKYDPNSKIWGYEGKVYVLKTN